MKKKYELVEDDFIIYEGRKLYRIKALKKFGSNTFRGADTIITKGQLGGYVEEYHNLSQKGDCWIYDYAKVYGNAVIKDDALICQSEVYDNAVVIGDSFISYSKVHDNARIEKKRRYD